jgi:hypothetical protein
MPMPTVHDSALFYVYHMNVPARGEFEKRCSCGTHYSNIQFTQRMSIDCDPCECVRAAHDSHPAHTILQDSTICASPDEHPQASPFRTVHLLNQEWESVALPACVAREKLAQRTSKRRIIFGSSLHPAHLANGELPAPFPNVKGRKADRSFPFHSQPISEERSPDCGSDPTHFFPARPTHPGSIPLYICMQSCVGTKLG